MNRFLVVLALLCPSIVAAQDARDTVLAGRIRANCATVSGWRTGQQTSTVRAALASCKANADSLQLKRIVTPPPPTNQAPVAGFGVTINDTTRLVRATSTSTDDKGIAAYAWAWGDGATSTATGAAQHTYAQAGTYTVSLTVRDAEGLTSTATKSVTLAAPIVVPPSDTGVTPVPQPPPPTDTARFAGAAELPRVTPNGAWSFAVLRVVRVPVGGDLQGALTAAKPGDEIRLAAGATYTGAFRLPTRCTAGQGITIRTDVPDPPAGVRVTPTTAAQFATIQTATSEWALRIDGPSCNVRLLAVALAVTNAPAINYGILWLGNGGYLGGGEYQTAMDSVPQGLVVDRVYVHGAPLANTRRCIALNSGATVIRDSWLSDCHATGDDSQAIAGWNGPGPYLIENNYLEGAGENVIFGGNDPGIALLTPSDITIRRNHIVKPLAWKGGPWQIKNLVELKNAKRVLFDSNVLENSWPAAQEGWAAIFASINQGGTTWGQHSTVQDVTFRWNSVKGAHHGIVIAEANDYAGVGATAAARITVSDNLWSVEDKTFVINSQFTGAMFARNTSGPARGWFQIGSQSATARFPGLAFTANRGGPAVYALNSPLGDGAAMFGAYGIPLTAFTGNCLATMSDQYMFTTAAMPGNQFAVSLASCTMGGVDQAALAKKLTGIVVAP